jgi:hypothetical protein
MKTEYNEGGVHIKAEKLYEIHPIPYTLQVFSSWDKGQPITHLKTLSPFYHGKCGVFLLQEYGFFFPLMCFNFVNLLKRMLKYVSY